MQKLQMKPQPRAINFQLIFREYLAASFFSPDLILSGWGWIHWKCICDGIVIAYGCTVLILIFYRLDWQQQHTTLKYTERIRCKGFAQKGLCMLKTAINSSSIWNEHSKRRSFIIQVYFAFFVENVKTNIFLLFSEESNWRPLKSKRNYWCPFGCEHRFYNEDRCFPEIGMGFRYVLRRILNDRIYREYSMLMMIHEVV